MQARLPDLDFGTSSPQWGDNVEAVAVINGGAIIPTAIERYIIRVLREAKKLLDPVANAELIAAVELLNNQQGRYASEPPRDYEAVLARCTGNAVR